MKPLILKTTRSHYDDTSWSDNDFVVLEDGSVGLCFTHKRPVVRGAG